MRRLKVVFEGPKLCIPTLTINPLSGGGRGGGVTKSDTRSVRQVEGGGEGVATTVIA